MMLPLRILAVLQPQQRNGIGSLHVLNKEARRRQFQGIVLVMLQYRLQLLTVGSGGIQDLLDRSLGAYKRTVKIRSLPIADNNLVFS